MLHLIGTGGINKRNPAQCTYLLSSVFQMFGELKNWNPLVESIWKTEHGANSTVPKELMEFIQNPIITRWWTVGDVALFMTKYWSILLRLANIVMVYAESGKELHTKAKELRSLMREPGMKVGIAFVAGFAKAYLNPNMSWYGKVDPNIGKPGRLAMHRLARYFLQVRSVNMCFRSGMLMLTFRFSPGHCR